MQKSKDLRTSQKKSHSRIEYSTETRVYQVSKIYKDIPRSIKNTFGRTVKCIYVGQLDEYHIYQYDETKKIKTMMKTRTTITNTILATATQKMKTTKYNVMKMKQKIRKITKNKQIKINIKYKIRQHN